MIHAAASVDARGGNLYSAKAKSIQASLHLTNRNKLGIYEETRSDQIVTTSQQREVDGRSRAHRQNIGASIRSSGKAATSQCQVLQLCSLTHSPFYTTSTMLAARVAARSARVAAPRISIATTRGYAEPAKPASGSAQSGKPPIEVFGLDGTYATALVSQSGAPMVC